MSALAAKTAGGAEARWVGPEVTTCDEVDALISAPLLNRKRWKLWWIAFAAASLLTAVMVVGIGVVLLVGVGTWGVNSTIVWGYGIASYVWWIGIGNAGTLISSMLLLTRQPWRASINRFAEAMTLFAASIAGIFPIIHLGRPMYFYWLAPYPNVMSLWPQWRSALVWDFWAIASYILFSLIFWYAGLIPDLATLRDRATRPWVRKVYGAFALGWRGSARHWAIHQTFYKVMAALAVPLVCSVHSIVGLDFAASLMPGWQESIFPPYFVVGAMFSGFAMVVILAAGLRHGFGLQALITKRHFDAIAKIILAASLVMFLSYATEWFMAWYSGGRAERTFLGYVFTGTYAPLYGALLFCNCLAPQVLWWAKVRASIPALIGLSVLILIGMWLERILIIWNTLGRGYLPSLWRAFFPTVWDWALLFGPVGFFAFMFLLFVRLVPSLSMFETRELVMKERAA